MLRSLAILASLLLGALPAFAQGTVYHVYYLGGQSNMNGLGYVRELPDSMRGPVEGVRIFSGNSMPDSVAAGGEGRWSELEPGYGFGVVSRADGVLLSDRFGVELSFAERMKELRPGERIALIKYARSGSSIDSTAAAGFGGWEPDFRSGGGYNQYDHFLATLRNAFAARDIDGDGIEDTLVPAGIVWMQGESDGHTPEVALRYEGNLKRITDLIRAALRVDDLPVVIGRISDSGQDPDGRVWNYGETVRAAQEAFVRKDPAAALVTSTDEYGYSDKWHYDTAGYIDLGRRFAEAMAALRSDAD